MSCVTQCRCASFPESCFACNGILQSALRLIPGHFPNPKPFLSPTDWSLEIVDLCKEFRNHDVVGLDIAGDESMGEIPAIKEHIMAFQASWPQ